MTRKTLPNSQEAEQGVLGSVLIWGLPVAFEVKDVLKKEMFFNEKNAKVYEAIEFLVQESKPIDLLSIRTYLDDRDALEYVWGNVALTSLTNAIFTTGNVNNYAKIVKNKWIRRSVLQAGQEISSYWLEEDTNIEDIFTSVLNTSKKVLALNTSGSTFNLEDDILPYQQFLETNKGKKLFGYSWWFEFADRLTKGLRKKKVYRVGAKSGMGKTQFLYNVMASLLKQGANVVFFTLENDRNTTLNNLLANLQGIDNEKLQEGLVKADVDLLFPYSDSLKIIDDIVDLEQILNVARRLKPDVLLLDYCGLASIKGVEEDKHYTQYSKMVQRFAKDEDVVWLDLSNLKMGDEDEPLKIIKGWQFYGSGSMKNNIDCGMHIVMNPDFDKFNKGVLELHAWDPPDSVGKKKAIDLWITKNRWGKEYFYKTYIMDFSKGWRWVEATKAEKDLWF